MKNVTLLILFLASVLFSACGKKSASGPPNSFKRYPYKNFHITYILGGDSRGTEEVFVSDWGRNEAQFSKSEIMSPDGIHSENHILLIRNAEQYTIDNQTRSFFYNLARLAIDQFSGNIFFPLP